MWSKFKKGVAEVKETSSLEAHYVMAKKRGFNHPQEVEEHINIHRKNRSQIPKIQEKLSKLNHLYKSLGELTDSFGTDFATFYGHEEEHEGVQRYMMAYANFQTEIARHLFLYQAVTEEMKNDLKKLIEEDLKEIRFKHDTTNRNLTDMEYFERKANSAKLQDVRGKYNLHSKELVEMIHRLREKKEEILPLLISKLVAAQAQYFQAAAEASKKAITYFKQLGKVQATPFEGIGDDWNPAVSSKEKLAMEQGGEEKSGGKSGKKKAKNGGHEGSVIPPPQSSGGDLVPAKGLYAFQGADDSELSFSPGDMMEIDLGKQNGDWYMAHMNGRSGYIPGNYVEFQ